GAGFARAVGIRLAACAAGAAIVCRWSRSAASVATGFPRGRHAAGAVTARTARGTVFPRVSSASFAARVGWLEQTATGHWPAVAGRLVVALWEAKQPRERGRAGFAVAALLVV